MITLFQLFTLDQWYKIYNDLIKVSNVTFTCIYILMWVWVGSFVFRNLFVGIMGKSASGVCVCWQHSFRIAVVVTTVQGCVQLIIFKKCVWIILCSLHYAFVCPYAISRAVCSQQLSEYHIRVSATPGDPAAEWGTGTHEERASPRTHQTWCQNAKSKVTVVRAAVQYIMFKITFCYTCSVRYIKYRMDN